MSAYNFISEGVDSTQKFGAKLARILKPGDIVCLVGDLGAGKTTLVKGMAKGIRIKPEDVHSPTFVLMNIYEGKIPLYHFDFYRLDDTHEIEMIGYEEFLYGEGISVIEWADRFGKLMPDEYLKIELKHKGESRRQVRVLAKGERYIKIIEDMNK